MRWSLIAGLVSSAVVIALVALVLRDPAPEQAGIAPVSDVAPAVDAVAQLDAVDVVRRTEVARGIDEAAYERAQAMRERRSKPKLAPASQDWRDGRIDVRVVRESDGAPLPRAELELTLSGVDAVTVASRTTDDAGAACFEGLPANVWKVTATAKGYRGRSTLDGVHPKRPEGTIEIRLAIQREIAVRLVDDAGNERTTVDLERTLGDHQRVDVAGVRACGPVGSSLEPGNQRYEAARGIGPVEGGDTWRLSLHGEEPRCVAALFGDTILGCTPLEPSVVAVDVCIGADVLRDLLAPLPVLVVGELDNLPIAGALVRFEDVSGVTEAQTDVGGRARIDARLRGGAPYTVSAAGFATARGTLVRKLGGQLLVSLAPGRRIQGFLRDENDAPLVRATVALHKADETGSRLARGGPTLLRTGPDGAFTFDGLEARTYAVGGRGDLSTESGAVERPADFVFVDCREKDALDVIVRRAAVPRPAASPRTRGPR